MSDQLQNLSARLKHALKILNISQTELAKKINVKPQIIQFLCSSQSQKSKFTFDIADALNIDVTWLATGNGTLPNSPVLHECSVPVLSYNLIRQVHLKKTNLDESLVTDWLPVNDNFSKKAFAMVLNENSMTPKFEKGTYIIVEPVDLNSMVQDEAFVVAYLAREDFILFRKLECLQGKKILSPINSTLYKSIKLMKEDKIIGLCKETRYQT